MNKGIDKYVENLPMRQFKIIEEISFYNNNYYIGLDNDLLFAHSDDDNITEWYLIEDMLFYYLGESHTSEDDLLIVCDRPRTLKEKGKQ